MLHTRYSARANNQTAAKTRNPFQSPKARPSFQTRHLTLSSRTDTHTAHTGFGYCNGTGSLAFESLRQPDRQAPSKDRKSAVTASEIVEALVSYSRTRTTVYFSKGV